MGVDCDHQRLVTRALISMVAGAGSLVAGSVGLAPLQPSPALASQRALLGVGVHPLQDSAR
jgi:hypothetical protein